MLLNYLMKKPMLTVGVIMFGLVAYQAAQKEQWSIFSNAKLNPTSCSAAIIKLNKNIPGNWRIYCEKNNLAIEIKELVEIKNDDQLRPALYRQLANHMVFTVNNSQIDSLEKVDIVRYKLMHPKLEINAVTTGNYIVKLQTIKDPKYILDHLKSTVKVKETVK
jgi:hypothetical protein